MSVGFVLLGWREREGRKGKGEEWCKRSTCSGKSECGRGGSLDEWS